MWKMKKTISIIVTLALAFMVLPGTAMAVEPDTEHWAYPSVDKLNNLYGSGTFSFEYDEPVYVGDLRAMLEDTFDLEDLNGYVGVYHVNDDVVVNRGILAHTLVKLFKLGDITGADDAAKVESAIAVCKGKGIMSGYSPTEFGKTDPVDNGSLASAFYRAVKKATGDGKNEWGLTPGKYGYDELLYFLIRGVEVGNVNNVYTTTFGAFELRTEDGGIYTIDSDVTNIWKRWQDMFNWSLDDMKGNHIISESVTFPAGDYEDAGLDANSKTVDAVIKMVEKYKDFVKHEPAFQALHFGTNTFYDVAPSDWYYDGIMYLFNKRYASGYGDGRFGPTNPLTRGEMASLITRVRHITPPDLTDPLEIAAFRAMFRNPAFYIGGNADTGDIVQWVAKSIWAAKDLYVGETDFAPDDEITRETMAYTTIQLYGENYKEENVNLAVLDRFYDKNLIGEAYKKPLAYLVSIGVLNGRPGEGADAGKIFLDPGAECDRGMAGAFLARVLQGIDKSKMKDYKDAVDYVKSGEVAE